MKISLFKNLMLEKLFAWHFNETNQVNRKFFFQSILSSELF